MNTPDDPHEPYFDLERSMFNEWFEVVCGWEGITPTHMERVQAMRDWRPSDKPTDAVARLKRARASKI